MLKSGEAGTGIGARGCLQLSLGPLGSADEPVRGIGWAARRARSEEGKARVLGCESCWQKASCWNSSLAMDCWKFCSGSTYRGHKHTRQMDFPGRFPGSR